METTSFSIENHAQSARSRAIRTCEYMHRADLHTWKQSCLLMLGAESLLVHPVARYL